MDMDTFIKANSRLIDIQSVKARNNLDLMVDYLCSSIVPDEQPSLNRLRRVTMQECHDYVSRILYSDENCILANTILQNRSEISNSYCLDGFSRTYDLSNEVLVQVSSNRFFQSVAVLEHEIIHILLALNKNNPEVQYNEFLSIFGEFLTLELLSKKYNNPNIYINHLINRCIKRMSFRVYGKDFLDAAIENQPDNIKNYFFTSYDYMIGFIYAIRLLDLYHQNPHKILIDFNLVLSGKKSVKALLLEYNISLEDSNTLNSFIKMVDSYREFVNIKYGESVHRVN